MENTGRIVCAEETSKCGIAGDNAEEDRKKLISEAATSTTCHDSGLSSGQDAAHTPKKVTTNSQRSRGKMLSPCMTSTPKKKSLELAGESDHEIMSSHMILEDPLLSSIDEPGNLTDNHVESLTSDEDSKDTTAKFHTTKVKARSDSSQKEPSLYKLVNDMTNTKISTSQSFSETIQQHVVEANAASVKKNLFDIPVSPKLKNRVRERLYTLVNSIEGYEDRVYLRDEETLRQFHNVESFSNINIKSPESTKNGVNTFSKVPGYSSLNVSSNQPGSFHDLSNASTLSNSFVERYGGCALSSIMSSQIKSLQHHQDQLNQEKISLAVQKKEQETNARISLYQEKLQLMIQMVEELELGSLKYQAAAREEAEHHQRRMKEQEEQHQEELAALRAECCMKIKEAEAEARSAQMAADKTCEQRLLEVFSSTQVKSAALEKEHEIQVSELKSAISKLKAEKRVLEASLESSTSEADKTGLVCGSPLLQGGREAVQGEPRKQTDAVRTGSSLYEDLPSIDLLKKKFQEEVEFWRKETERLQKKLREADVMQRKLISDTFQDLHSNSKTDLEMLQVQTADESEELRSTVAILQEQLSQALKENSSLKQKLNDCHKREMDLIKKLSLREDEVCSLKAQLKLSEIQVLQQKENLEVQLKQCAEHHKHTMFSYRHDVERETSAAVSAALACHQEKTHYLLAQLRARYEALIRRIRAHSRAQINEYKKAVRCLKERNKITEKD